MAKKISKAAKEQAKGILSNWIVRNLLLAAALIAGLLLIAREAGGVCCQIDGEALPLDPSRPSVAAGGPQALRELIKLAKEIN